MKRLELLLPLLGLLGSVQAYWEPEILPGEDDINIDDDLRALEAVLVSRNQRKGRRPLQMNPAWPWSGDKERGKNRDKDKGEDKEEEDEDGEQKPPRKNPLWPWNENDDKDKDKDTGKKPPRKNPLWPWNKGNDRDNNKRPPREKPLWPQRIPEEDLEQPDEEPVPSPWGREDLELPPYDGPFVMARQPKRKEASTRARKLPPLNLRDYHQKRRLRALEQSLDRTKGKVKRVVREPCIRCRRSGGKGPSCRACHGAGDDEGSRPIHPWAQQTGKTAIIEKPDLPTRRLDKKLIFVKRNKEHRLVEVNQINLHFDVDVRQQQQQQEKQGIAKIKKGSHHHRRHHGHCGQRRQPRALHSLRNPPRRWVPEADMEGWLQRRYNPYATGLVLQPSSGAARSQRVRRHPTEVDAKYPSLDEDKRRSRQRSKKGSPKEDVDGDESLGRRIKEAWKRLKRTLKQWGKSVKNYLGGVAKRFEDESSANKIALLLVVGLIIFLQTMAAVKIVRFCREQTRKDGKASYIRLPAEEDEKSTL